MAMKQNKTKIMFVIEIFFILMGIIASLFLFHELYHLHNGIPTGVCIGNCFIPNSEETAPAILFFNKILVIDVQEEERQAWFFSFMILLTFLAIYLFLMIKNYKGGYRK